MTNQLNISLEQKLKWTSFWLFSKVFLVFLIGLTLFSSVIKVTSAFYIFNIAILSLFLVVLLLLKYRKKQNHFIKIDGNQLSYFCPVKKENINIPALDIIKVTTQFCELQIHTSDRTHCLNLNNIKEETTRWEIKEMIRKLALENGNRAVNF